MKQTDRGINIPIPKSYSCTQRAFCVPCVDRCRNNQGELSKIERNRRRLIYMDIETPSSVCPAFTKSLREFDGQNQMLTLPTVQLLHQLYKQGKHNHNDIFESLKCKRLNPVEGAITRDDIEYYIPQLITFLAFQIDLDDEDLVEFIMRGCQLHYLFSHCCYFYLNSISKVGDFDIPEIQSFIQDLFLPRMEIYKESKLCGLELARCSNIPIEPVEPTTREIEAAEKYGTIEEDECSGQPVRNVHIKNYSDNGFMSTPSFWFDLIKVGNDLASCNPKIVGLKNSIRDINRKLPSAVYIPFFRHSLRHYTILSIDVDHARVFSTKERSPYSIYIEIFREEEEFLKVEESKIQTTKDKRKAGRKAMLLNRTISKPLTIIRDQNSLRLTRLKTVEERKEQKNAWRRSKDQRSTIHDPERAHVIPRISYSVIDRKQNARSFNEGNLENRLGTDHALGLSDIQEGSHTDGARSDNSNSGLDEGKNVVLHEPQESPHLSMRHNGLTESKEGYIDRFFDTPFSEIQEQIRKRSIYRNFKTWKLVNVMVKTGDNLKQEQFAMQLINQFDSIFKRENIDLLLRPYEVISLGPDSGILQMVTDTSSMGRILKNMLRENIPTLKQFFKYYFKSRHEQAKNKFCHSLAAYSLVTYFLQVKDRHNDNILLHRDGYIVHIDFGFFLSNAPGKGIELEKNCPFKLMGNYVEVLGGANSLQFMEFRSLFERGFRACLKYKDEIITLVKMMYSSHGESMPCFQKGSVAIDELEQRFDPRAQDLGQHCQKYGQILYSLINQSLDNWRARWYDKVQYWLQGIFY